MAVGQAVGQRHAQLGRDVAGREFADEFAHADEQFAGREFGERHRGDGLGRDAFGQHHGDAAGHDGGLARARAGLDQDRAIVDADRGAARIVIGERLCIALFITPPPRPARLRPRRSVAAAILRLQ